MKKMVDIPKPSVEQIEYWLKYWNTLDDYREQEIAINKLFQGEFKSNDDIHNILIKCSILNDFYSTNIFKIYFVATHILSLNIDERLKKGDDSLIDEIAKVEISGKEKIFYSFASKYCSHHNQNDFPIYDSYVHKMLVYFQKLDKFYNFKSEDLKDYKTFKQALTKFKDFYGLEKYNLKQLDKYLWLVGKKYFTKKYK